MDRNIVWLRVRLELLKKTHNEIAQRDLPYQTKEKFWLIVLLMKSSQFVPGITLWTIKKIK